MLEAVRDLVARDGYDALRYDDVAEHAGVHKTTVYRRWPDKAELVAESVGFHAAEAIPLPDTGSLSEDLAQLATAVAANLATGAGGGLARAVVAASAGSPELAERVHTFMRRRIEQAEALVDRAKQRGEIPETADSKLVVEGVVGPIWFRFLLTGEPVDPSFARAAARQVASGLL